jgi:carbon starvation protein
MTIWTMAEHVFFEWSGWGAAEGDALLFVFGALILGFAIWIILEAIRLMGRPDKELVDKE